MVDITTLAQDCLEIIQSILRKDTGNLAFNATQIRYTNTGFSIVVIEEVAPYVVFVKDMEKDWARAYAAVGGYVAGVLTGEKNNINATKQTVAEQSPSTPEREFRMLQSMSNVDIR